MPLPPVSNLIDLLQYRASSQGDQVAYRFLNDGENESDNLTYGKLATQSETLATALHSLAAPGERVLLLLPSGLDFITAFFGCLWAQVVAVPAYPPRKNQRLERLLAILRDAQPSVILTTQALVGQVHKECQEIGLQHLRCEEIESLLKQQKVKRQPVNISPNTLAFLQYTSGSTGKPKGVMVSHANILHNSEIIYQAFGHSTQSKGVIWLPPFHDMGLIGGILQPVYGGFPVTLMSPETVTMRPLTWLKAITQYRATTSGGPNFAYDWCVQRIKPEQLSQLDLSSWEIAFTGAEPVRANTLKQFAEKFACCGFRAEVFYPCYGMAETTLFITGGTKGQRPRIIQVDAKALEQNQAVPPQEQQQMRELVSCGYTWLDQGLAVVDPNSLTVCSEGKVGEIWVAGESVTQGYWQQSETTQATFHAYLTESQKEPFLRTGDLGFLHEGELFVTGRLKDLIIIRGRNHYPQDIEMTVQLAHPDLRANAGAAFSVDIEGHEQLVIVQEVERTALRTLDTEAVINAIRQAVSEQHEVQVYAVELLKTGSIPMTSSGKILRHACRKGFLSNTLEVVGSWTAQLSTWEESQLEQQIETLNQYQTQLTAPISQEVIQDWLAAQIALTMQVSPDEIEIDVPLASFGLDSSLAVSLTGRLGEWLHLELEATLFWEYPTIEKLAEYLIEILKTASCEQSRQSEYQDATPIKK